MRNGSRGAVRSLLREPLVHFLALGVGLFLLFRVASSPSELDPSEIGGTAGQIDHIIEVFSKTRQRPPSPAELQGLIDDHVLEEVLYREAIAMGLDKGDTIVRRRMRQKMEFLVDDFASSEPTEEELLTFLNENTGRFRGEPKSSFEHIVFRHGSGDQAEQLLATLQAGGTVDVSPKVALVRKETRYRRPRVDSLLAAAYVRCLSEGAMSIRPVKRLIKAKPTIEGAGVHHDRGSGRPPWSTCRRPRTTRARADQARA